MILFDKNNIEDYWRGFKPKIYIINVIIFSRTLKRRVISAYL